MLVNGHDLDVALRRAKRRRKGARGGAAEARVARQVAELAAWRDYYQTVVHARFDLDAPRQTTLAVAVHYAKVTRAPRRSRLREQIAEARRVRVEIEEWDGNEDQGEGSRRGEGGAGACAEALGEGA